MLTSWMRYHHHLIFKNDECVLFGALLSACLRGEGHRILIRIDANKMVSGLGINWLFK
jgi:hypothetical protein